LTIEQRDLFQDLGIDPLGLFPQQPPFLRRKNNSLFARQVQQLFFQSATFLMQPLYLPLLVTFRPGNQPSLQPSQHDRSLMLRPGGSNARDLSSRGPHVTLPAFCPTSVLGLRIRLPSLAITAFDFSIHTLAEGEDIAVVEGLPEQAKHSLQFGQAALVWGGSLLAVSFAPQTVALILRLVSEGAQ
jgi:hypothetical protein